MSRSSLRSLVLVVGGIGAGLAIALGVSTLTGSDEAERTSFGREATGDTSSLLDADRLAEVEGPRERASSPQEAVQQFLGAEQAADYERSFALLADAARVEYGSAAAWRADHPDAIPPITGYRLDGEPTGGDGRAEVPVVTSYRSTLDPVVGLVPARAKTRWVAVQEDGGWAVDVLATTQQPVLPPDDDAVAAVQQWAQERQRCGTPDQQFAGGLRGQRSLADALCDSSGGVRASGVTPLSQVDAQDFQSSFGADVVSWARTVAVDGPVPLRAVVAPVDDRWLVIGVLPPPGQGG